MLPHSQLLTCLLLASLSNQHLAILPSLHQIQPDPKYFPNKFSLRQFDPPVIESFDDFVTAFNVSFANPAEEAERKAIFERNFENIEAHNRVNDIKKVVTKFLCFTSEEITAEHTGAK